ncbi:hypothetical protein M378DRAFT_159678 [Amanita muscaria Koide BX008]|uniref:Uncharacterized protein n=1 Tax=Amanita muscaria (strain Koide BX008) TaxID=946122 RepID=A0A0C2SV18_AMAMK|nr:hypothetical protein M378DRAFT_159678 [Amanita muscaria Koide BX008]
MTLCLGEGFETSKLFRTSMLRGSVLVIAKSLVEVESCRKLSDAATHGMKSC